MYFFDMFKRQIYLQIANFLGMCVPYFSRPGCNIAPSTKLSTSLALYCKIAKFSGCTGIRLCHLGRARVIASYHYLQAEAEEFFHCLATFSRSLPDLYHSRRVIKRSGVIIQRASLNSTYSVDT